MLIYSDFFRRYGLRKVGNLNAPVFNSLDKLQLPRESVYIFQPQSEIEDGPALDDLYLKAITRPIKMSHITELAAFRGNPRLQSVVLQNLIRKYHIKNKKYRLSRSYEDAVRDPMVPYVINTALMQRRYKYVRNIYTEYNKWYNSFYTMIAAIGKMATQSTRNIFIEVAMPEVLPNLGTLRMLEQADTGMFDKDEDTKGALGIEDYVLEPHNTLSDDLFQRLACEEFTFEVEGKRAVVRLGDEAHSLGLEAMSATLLRRMTGGSSFVIGELWKWLGSKRIDSIFTLLTGHYEKINLIFRVGQFWTVVNLGVLDSWRRTPEKEHIAIPLWTDEDVNPVPDPEPKYAEARLKGMMPKQMQIMFMHFLIKVFELKTPIVNPDEVVNQVSDVTANADGSAQALVDNPTATAPDQQVVNQTAPQDQLVDTGKEAEDASLDEKALDDMLTKLAEMSNAVSQAQAEAETTIVQPPKTPEQGILTVIDKLAEEGSISAAEYKRYQTMAESYKKIQITDHLGNDVSLAEFIQIPPDMLKLDNEPMVPDIETVPDKSMLKSSLEKMDREYVKKVLQRDVAGMVINLQKAGIVVTDYGVEKVEDISGAYMDYALRINPVEGMPSTLRFRLPAVDEDGVYRANGTKYRLRKQRGDLPIRKTGPDSVALTSYYGKVFVYRSNKRTANYGTWLTNALMAAGFDPTNTLVTEPNPNNAFDNKFVCPRLYSTLAMVFRNITINGWTWLLDHNARETLFGKDFLNEYEKDGTIAVAINGNGDKMLMDKLNGLYSISNGVVTELPSIEEQAGLILAKRPVEFSEVKLSGRKIPVGLVLAYYYGYDKLCQLLKVRPRIVGAGERLQLGIDEFPVLFADETHIFSRDDLVASMILGGLADLSDLLKVYSAHEFNKPGVYLNIILGTRGGAVRHIREMDLIDKLFVDPITLELLTEMKEPTDFRGLLVRASELLLQDHHPDEVDPAFMRIRGYERLAGAAYKEMVAAVKAHNSRANRSRYSIEMNPRAVWQTIASDPSVSIVEETNPIQNLKEVEAVTYNGVGGRSGRSMTKKTRIYHQNEMGTISESTVDSGDVGINIYTSANPTFTTVRGISTPQDPSEIEATSLMSTSALISPGSDRDDPKRVNFIGIQQRHVVPCVGYTQAAVRTGYEQVIGHRTGDLFCTTAKQAGKVISVSEEGIIVEFEDGTRKGIELGTRYGKVSDIHVPHNVITKLQVGEKFSAGDVLAFNEGFFEEDLFNPNQVVMKSGVLVNVVLMEAPVTLEDSSAISKETAALLTSKLTKVKQVVVDFSQQLHRVQKQGATLSEEDILCIIEDSITSDNKLFDEESLETLKLLGSHTPKAKTHGVLDRIEVYYHGDKEDMSSTLRQLADFSDRQLGKRLTSAGKKRFTGSVDDGYRVNGDPLMLDTACIKFYITGDVPAGVGDKGVFANQMKTVFGEVLPMDVATESGEKIGAIFGQKSIDDRIVNSPELIGTTTVLLELIGKKAAEMYFKK